MFGFVFAIILLVALWMFVVGKAWIFIEPTYGQPQVLPSDAIRLERTFGDSVEVVGESHYQLNIRRAKGSANKVRHWREFWARLEHEPTNRVDPNAVRVGFNSLTLGYLKRDDARHFLDSHRDALRSKRPIFCEARIVGGTWGKPNYGVFLDFDLDADEDQELDD
jgi:uncharacterized membrane protein